MNPTIEKFGFPASLIREFDHWVVLARPAQVTLGSLVLAARSDATSFSTLPTGAFTEQANVTLFIEQLLASFVQYERLNYIMLMMVDPQVHFHVIPRYSRSRSWRNVDFPDTGWPGLPRLDAAVKLGDTQLSALVDELRTSHRSIDQPYNVG